MNELYIWFYTISRKPKGTPQAIDMWVRENFQAKKTPEGLTYPWVSYNYRINGFPPLDDRLKFPKELYFIVQNQKELLFDCVSYQQNIIIVSESFLNFLMSKGMSSHFEIATLKIVHKNKIVFPTTKNYFAIRIGKYDNEYFDFGEVNKKRAAGLKGIFLYPDLKLKVQETMREIFIIDEFCYADSFIFTGNIKDEIKKTFYLPEIYNTAVFPFVFNNRLQDDKLPPSQ